MSKGGYRKVLTELQAAKALIADLRKRLAQTEAHMESERGSIDAPSKGKPPRFKWQDGLAVVGLFVGLAAMNDFPIWLRLMFLAVSAICLTIAFLGHKDWPKKWRWTTSVGICALMAMTGYFTWSAWEDHTAKGTIAVYFSESRRFPADVIDVTHGLAPVEANMEQAFAKAPVHQLRLRPGAGKIVMSVVIQNTSNVPIRNAHIQILSKTPITGKTLGVFPWSDKAISYDDRVLRPFSRLGEEYFISVEFEDESTIPRAIVGVIVDADNMDPYVGGGVFSLLRP